MYNKNEIKAPTIVNIYNFIRKTVYPSGEFVYDDFKTIIHQLEILKEYGLPATYALKYDALIDERFSNLIKESIDDYDEVGIWWEIDKQLAEKSGVKWKGNTPVDDHVNIGYSLGYSREDRIKMVDVYMKDFKEIFGYYPKSVGSWVIDIVTLEYLKEKYSIEAVAICRDQIGTDGFTLWGGYFNQGYYPSKINEYMPSQNKEMQLDLPIFRMLAPDPIYAFEDGLRKSVNGVYTLEPAAVIAQNKDWVKWLFERHTNEEVLGFSYVQAGQENTFLWNTMRKGYELQIPYIKSLASEGKIRVETLKETGRWFKNKYKLTPPTTLTASEDWNKDNLRIMWYNSRFYRISFLYENMNLSIRDMHIFNENYKSRYYDNTLESNESIFDALPILNAHYWSDDNKRASIDLIRINNLKELDYIKGYEPNFSVLDDATYKTLWKTIDNSTIEILCKESEIIIKEDINKNLGLHINKFPILKYANKKEIICEHNNFTYSLYLIKGEFILKEDSSIIINSEDNEIRISVEKEEVADNKVFYSDYYLKNKKEVDEYIPKYKRIKVKSKLLPRALRPRIFPKTLVMRPSITEKVIIENPNKEGEIRYTLDGSEPNLSSLLYKEPIVIKEPLIIKAKAFRKGYKESEIEEGRFYSSLLIKDIKSFTTPVDIKKYNKNGVYDLIDRKKGSEDYTDGNWLGYHEDLNVIVDLGEEKNIRKVTVGFLQDTRAWIYYPRFIDFKVSSDGEVFTDIKRIYYKNSIPRKEVAVEDISASYIGKARYIRIFAKNEEICPEWSIMAGEGPAFMFVDEITVE